MPGLFYPPFCLLWQTFRPASVFSEKRKMVDNRLIINHLRERKTGLGPATSTLARLRSTNWAISAIIVFGRAGQLYPHLGSGLRNLRFGTANINRKIYSAKFSGEFCRKITLVRPKTPKKETSVQMRSRRHARRQRPAANGNKNKAAGNGSLIYIRIALRANPD